MCLILFRRSERFCFKVLSLGFGTNNLPEGFGVFPYYKIILFQAKSVSKKSQIKNTTVLIVSHLARCGRTKAETLFLGSLTLTVPLLGTAESIQRNSS